jgi:hydrogenase maturation protease
LNEPAGGVLILGIGNVLMGDEGVGVHVVRRVQDLGVPPGVLCLDGGTGSFQLLGPIQEASRLILIDAAADPSNVGAIRTLTPRFSSEYPSSLTAHDIGLKDLLDALYLTTEPPPVTLIAVSIDPDQEMGLELSPELEAIVPGVAQMAIREALKESDQGDLPES